MALPARNQAGVRLAVYTLLKALGENPKSPHLRDTPKRVAEMADKILDGRFLEKEEDYTSFAMNYQGMVAVHGVPFYSFCAHHIMPFYGTFSIAYIPKPGKVLGLSKLVRIFREGCKRLTTQEDVTQKAVERLMRATGARGAICHTEAEHMCMSLRGVQARGATTVLTVARGVLDKDKSRQAEQFIMRATSRKGS